VPVVSVINYKGGVGKTTLTANIGAELAYRGKRVLLMDMDAQSSLTFSFVRPDYWEKRLSSGGTIKDWYDSFDKGSTVSLSSLVITPSKVNSAISGPGRLDLVPSHLGLINVDLELATELSAGSLKQAKQKYLGVHRRLAEALSGSAFDEYDVILIDCPPNFNIVTKNAIVASDQVLIPAKPDYLSTLGIDYLHRSLRELIDDYNDYATLDSAGPPEVISPSVLGVVFTMVQFYAQKPIAAQRAYIDQARRLGLPLFKNYIRENKTHFGDAPEYGLPVILTDQPASAHIVRELEALTTEFVKHVGI
jgi:chromosome partitioning protein